MGQVGKKFALRENPVVDAQFSAQYTAALAFIRGRPRLRDFEEERIKSSGEIMGLAGRFKCVEEVGRGEAYEPSARLSILLKDGTHLETYVEYPLGSSRKPMTDKDIEFKLNDCFDYVALNCPDKERVRIRQTLSHVVDTPDMAGLIGSLVMNA